MNKACPNVNRRLFAGYTTSRVPYMNRACPIYELGLSHIWTRLVPYMNKACPIYEWVMRHVWMGHSHTWMRRVPHMNEACPIYEWVMSHLYQAVCCSVLQWILRKRVFNYCFVNLVTFIRDSFCLLFIFVCHIFMENSWVNVDSRLFFFWKWYNNSTCIWDGCFFVHICMSHMYGIFRENVNWRFGLSLFSSHLSEENVQCVAVCCNVVQCVAVCCSVLQRDAVYCIRQWMIRHWIIRCRMGWQ